MGVSQVMYWSIISMTSGVEFAKVFGESSLTKAVDAVPTLLEMTGTFAKIQWSTASLNDLRNNTDVFKYAVLSYPAYDHSVVSE